MFISFLIAWIPHLNVRLFIAGDIGNMTKQTFSVMCLECGWCGTDYQLIFPPHILDDDLVDYGGDCPSCGNNEVIDYDETEYTNIYPDEINPNNNET